MPFARIWYEPNGDVKITYFVDGADVGQVISVLKNDKHVDKDSTFEDCETEAELRGIIPADRKDRDKWTKNDAGRGVKVDPNKPPKVRTP